eukprot:Rmarinus@m.26339
MAGQRNSRPEVYCAWRGYIVAPRRKSLEHGDLPMSLLPTTRMETRFLRRWSLQTSSSPVLIIWTWTLWTMVQALCISSCMWRTQRSTLCGSSSTLMGLSFWGVGYFMSLLQLTRQGTVALLSTVRIRVKIGVVSKSHAQKTASLLAMRSGTRLTCLMRLQTRSSSRKNPIFRSASKRVTMWKGLDGKPVCRLLIQCLGIPMILIVLCFPWSQCKQACCGFPL